MVNDLVVSLHSEFISILNLKIKEIQNFANDSHLEKHYFRVWIRFKRVSTDGLHLPHFVEKPKDF